jgi:hypothetical protein
LRKARVTDCGPGARRAANEQPVPDLSGRDELKESPNWYSASLGPTGSGKTRVVEAAAEVLFGDPNAIVKIDCAEFQHSHEIAELIGSPPGYLGHRETSPPLTQENLDRTQTDDLKLSLVLFDEIEKASDSLWQLLLGTLDKATLTLGDRVSSKHGHIKRSSYGPHMIGRYMILDLRN